MIKSTNGLNHDESLNVMVDDIEFSTLARRIARRLVLSQFCDKDHLVLKIEEELTEIASSKFQEQLLIKLSKDRISNSRPLIESKIRSMIEFCIESMHEEITPISKEVKERALSSLKTMNFDSLFLVIH